MKEVYLAGLDIGGTKLSAVIANSAGETLARLQAPAELETGNFTRFDDGSAYDGLARKSVALLRNAMQEAGITEILAIGIGAAGPLAKGSILNPTNILLPEIPDGLPQRPLYLPLVEPLQQEFAVPVNLENDCNTAVLGEVEFGVGKGIVDKSSLHIVYVTISTGFGAGVWSDGRLLRGKDGNAAEIGHILVREGGLLCGCGNRGCVEAYCSGRGIVRNAQAKLAYDGFPETSLLLKLAANKTKSGEVNRFALLTNITPPLVFRAAKEGDAIAQAVINDAIFAGGVALATISNAYDPETIVLGGSIAINHPELCAPMEAEMKKHLNVVPPVVQLSPLKDRAVEYGAIVLARQAWDQVATS